MKKRDGENENITEERNGSLSRRRKNFLSDLRKGRPTNLQVFTDTIEKIMKIFQE